MTNTRNKPGRAFFLLTALGCSFWATNGAPFAITATLALGAFGSIDRAQAHSWYPRECCHDVDCAPVDTATWTVPAGGGPRQLLVTSRFGVAIVPNALTPRESQDGRMHVCMAYDEFGSKSVLCFFVPPMM